MTTIGRYEIIGELGRGGMGRVFRAFDPKLRRVVALKTIRFDLIAEGYDLKVLLDRFQLEAQAAAKLNHPNIVTIYDVGEHDGVAYIVMEFIEGQTLKQVARTDGPPRLAELLGILHDTASGLDHAHDAQVLHRDVKPANILVRNDGVAKLTDFGIAKISTVTGITQTGAVMGTLHYIAPEYLKGVALDRRADQYSLAVVAYEVIAGVVPFDAPTPEALMLRVLTQDPNPICRINPNFSLDVDMVLSAGLAKSPERRFPSCTEFVVALADSLRIPRSALAASERERLRRDEERAWASVARINNPDELEVFLGKYGSGPHGLLAATRLQSLRLEDQAWDSVRGASEPSPVRDFLARSPGSRYSEQACILLGHLEEVHWRDIRNSFDPADFRHFLSEFPDSAICTQVQERLVEAERHAAAWECTSQSHDASAGRAFLNRFPDSPHVGEAARMITALETEAALTSVADCHDNVPIGLNESEPLRGISSKQAVPETMKTPWASAVKQPALPDAEPPGSVPTAPPRSGRFRFIIAAAAMILTIGAALIWIWPKSALRTATPAGPLAAITDGNRAKRVEPAPTLLPRQDVSPITATVSWMPLKDSTDLTALERFAKKFSAAPEAALARQRVQSLRSEQEYWNGIKDAPNPQALNGFLEKFPRGKFAKEARSKLLAMQNESDAWDSVRISEDTAVLSAFISRFPSGPHTQAANDRLNEVRRAESAAWEAAMQSRDPAVLEAFVSRYPASSRIGDAQLLIGRLQAEARAWDNIAKSKNPSVFQSFLSTYPDGRYKKEASARLAELTADDRAWAEFQNGKYADPLRRYLESFPNGTHSAEATLGLEAQKAEDVAAVARSNPPQRNPPKTGSVQPQKSAPGGLNIVFVSGSPSPGGIVCRVEAEDHSPVAGATVMFILPLGGPGGRFEGGAVTATVVTNASGQAAMPRWRANRVIGKFRVRVDVSFHGRKASRSMEVTHR
jgi:serine/threonine protein kinase